MKNNAKRMLAFLLAALLCVTMVVPAFATEADAAHDHEYKHEVNCDDDCDHKCPTGHATSCVIEVVKSVCTAAGYTLKYCDDCDHYFVTDVVPAEEGAAHNPGDKVEEGKAPTCVSEGVETSYKCTVCGELCDKDGGEVDKLDVIKHEYKDGLCVICGKHEDDSCVGEHEWEFVKVSVKPTATTNGTAVYECKECGALKEVVILAENARIYPSSLYADIDFAADGTMADRLGKLELTLKGATISETDVTFNKTTLKLPTLNVTAGGQQGLATFKEFTADTIGDFWNDADGFSFEALFINRAQSGTQGVFCSTEGAGLGLATVAGVPGLCTYIGNNNYKYTKGTVAVSTTEYTHVISTVVVDATGLHTAVYVNGKLAASENFAGADIYTEAAKYIPYATQFSIGSDVGYEFKNTNFSVADIKVYGSALTQEDVTMLYGYVVEDFTEAEEPEVPGDPEVPEEHTCSKDTLTAKPAVAGTCTEKGTIAHYECSCGKLYADAEAKTLITSIEGDFGHTYGDTPTEEKAATCDKFGYKLWACTKCGDVKAENIPPKGHANWDDEDRAINVVTEKATCTKPGKITWTCKDCNTEMKEDLKATGCTLVTVEVKATCSTYAFTYTYCSNEGCDVAHVAVPEGYFATVSGKYEGEKDATTGKWVAKNLTTVVKFEITGTELDATNHYHAVIGEVSTEANCKEAGTKVDYCLGCHEIDKSYTYGPEGHKFGAEVELSKANCVAAAQYKKVCELCGHTETYAKGEALGHKYGDVQTTPATCATKGEKYKVCSVCTDTTEGHKVVVEELPYKSSAVNGVYADYETAAKEHILVAGSKENYRPGDCLNIGLDKYTCEKCGDVFVQTGVGGEGHKEGTVTITAQKPTCTDAGWTAEYVCSECGATVASLPLAALGHTMTEVVAKDATCDEDGDVAHFHCATCGKNFEDAEGKTEITTTVVIPALGHKFVAGVCTECNYACEHKLDLIKISLAACASDDKGTYGYKHFGCEECGYECWTNFVDIPEHVFVEKETAADCTHTGKVWEECACGKTQNEVIIPETHYNVDGDPIIDSCLDAEEDRLCDKCGETIGKAHNEITTVVDNTCTTLGYTIVACGDCGEVISTVANTTLGEHKYGAPVIVDSTYIAEGTKTEVCTVCGYNKVTTIEKKAGLNIDLVASNKYGYDAYVDGSYVTVKVVADANNVDLWSYRINVKYDNTVLKYVETTIATTVCDTTVSGLAHNNGNYVTLLGYASNDADANMQNVTLNGEDIVIAEITFQVNSAAEVKAAFSVEVVDIIEKDNTDVVAELGANLTTGTEEITTEIYLDINNDGVRDIEDLNSMVKLMKNIADKDVIEAAADANHDGKIGEADLSILMQLLVGAKTYTTYATMAK